MKPLGKVNMMPSPELYYAIGLITTDGSLSKDGRHIVFTSKDRELVDILQSSLHTHLTVGRRGSGATQGKKYFDLQIGDVQFYRFLLSIGLMPNKTKAIKELKIPDKYFFVFLRGHFDGDGSFYSYFDPRWKSSFLFYTVFCSASKEHILWLQKKVHSFLGIRGHITSGGKHICYQLKYAKSDSLILLKNMYRRKNLQCLQRKKSKIQEALTKVGKSI